MDRRSFSKIALGSLTLPFLGKYVISDPKSLQGTDLVAEEGSPLVLATNLPLTKVSYLGTGVLSNWEMNFHTPSHRVFRDPSDIEGFLIREQSSVHVRMEADMLHPLETGDFLTAINEGKKIKLYIKVEE